ncbi:hypothetical protein SDC9_202030 [bioreactor metagenome]|uniref:Uncharacterized protein n=1 Tax=bioreactor metagenome TaxID=1076179 RepID=A0A645ITY9_9ZZZZ
MFCVAHFFLGALEVFARGVNPLAVDFEPGPDFQQAVLHNGGNGAVRRRPDIQQKVAAHADEIHEHFDEVERTRIVLGIFHTIKAE